MTRDAASALDWRDAANYAPLLDADRSMFAWEWLRRDPAYRAAARACDTGPSGRAGEAAHFGLLHFEPAELAVPIARPLWHADAHPYVLGARSDPSRSSGDEIDLRRFRDLVRLAEQAGRTSSIIGRASLDPHRCPDRHVRKWAGLPRYMIGGVASAQPPLLTLRRFLALCRTERFSRVLHPPEPRARRWIMMLRARDALNAGAGQREIAEVLLSRSVGEPRWRGREPSIRSQAQRLVRSARLMAEGGYRSMLG